MCRQAGPLQPKRAISSEVPTLLNVSAREVGLLAQLRGLLREPETRARFRLQPHDWTRQRLLTFEVVVAMILQGHKLAFASILQRTFGWLNRLHSTPQPASFCEARHKLAPEIFLALTQATTQDFYTRPRRELMLALGKPSVQDKTGTGPNTGPNTDEVSLVWHDHRVLSVDGTKWNLPNTPQNRERFGTATNQHDAIGCAQSQGLVLYDVLNDLGLHAVPAPATEGKVPAEKTILFGSFLPFTEPGDVVVLDRGYGAYSVLAFWDGNERYYVIRMTHHSFKAVREFWKHSAGHERAETTVKIAVTPDQKKFVREQGLPLELTVRLIKITLPNGEEEVLATNLLDTQLYPAAEIAELYRQRWQIEGYIDRLKNIFEIERLAVQRPDHLLQDFYGVLFLSTLESVLTRRDQNLLERRTKQRDCVHKKQVNRAQSYLALVDRALELLLDNSKEITQTLEELHFLFQWNPTLQRTGRSFSRNKTSQSRRLRFQKYTKRALT